MGPDGTQAVHIVGGGLAGSEAAWQLACRGIDVVMHEMRPDRMTGAHKSATLAELVCSNSFRSDEWRNNAVGLLHEEMRRLGSLIMRAADASQVPAGGALGGGRGGFFPTIVPGVQPQTLVQVEREHIGHPHPHFSTILPPPPPLTPPPPH